ncbi:MAG: hypothetical protein KI788_00595 [Mameliella sp.]|nr:hypothetical protein [Mameliella sp.]
MQKILHEDFGIVPVDDADILRRHVAEIADIPLEQTQTEDGKASFVNVLGRDRQVREMLGVYGKLLEGFFGGNIISHIAIRSVLKTHAESHTSAGYCPTGYSFGSVRRDQGRLYQEHGGVVVLVRGNRTRTSGECYDFDQFDQSLVNFEIENNFSDLDGLRSHVKRSGLGAWLLGCQAEGRDSKIA